MNRRGLDSHLLHQNAQRRPANLGQFEKRCRPIGIATLRFACKLEKFPMFVGGQKLLFQPLRQ